MPPDDANRDRKNYTYTMDDGNQLIITMRGQTGDGVANPVSTAAALSPVRTKFCRHIGAKYIESGKVYRRRVIICNPASAIWQGSQDTFQIGTTTWTITSRNGEKRGGAP